MRTTILIGSLLFLAGYAPAQDSPITVGDSSTQPPPAGKQAGTTGHSIYVQHKHFNGNGDNYHVKDKDNQAACFDVVNLPPNRPVPLGQQWTLVLSDGVVLTTTDGNRVDIVYNGKQVNKGSAPNKDDLHTVVGDQLTSGWLINGGQATAYPVNPTTPATSQTFIIHYCPAKGGVVNCKDPKTGVNPCQ
jgi:hypothetical protein